MSMYMSSMNTDLQARLRELAVNGLVTTVTNADQIKALAMAVLELEPLIGCIDEAELFEDRDAALRDLAAALGVKQEDA